jgi:hypothetical protein
MTDETGRATEAKSRRSRLARAGLLLMGLAAVAGLGLLVSACGGSSKGGVAQVETTTAATTTEDSPARSDSGLGDPTAYSKCMRENGVPQFPDPDPQGRLVIPGGRDLDPNSPRFKAAEKACGELLPRGGDDAPSPEEAEERLQEALAYAACMRENGVPTFPDPKTNAEGGIDLNAGDSDFDPFSPQFKRAEEACKELLPGGEGRTYKERATSPEGTR